MKKLITLLFLVISLQSQADFFSAMDQYKAQHYANAYNEFLSMAIIGEKRSQFNIGIMYYYGQHVEKDINKAYAWLKLSVENELSDKKTISNNLAAFNTITAAISDKNLAEDEYKKLKVLYSDNVLLEKLYPVIVKAEGENSFHAKPTKIVNPKWPRKALLNGIQGWVQVQFDIDIKGAPRNLEVVSAFPKTIFVQGAINAIKKWRFEPKKDKNDQFQVHSNVRYSLEYRLEGGNGLVIKKELYKKTQEQALNGNANAQFKIGYWDKVFSDSKHTINPNEWFLKASKQGHPAAQYELGRSLVYGKGCKVDKTKGISWLTRSASNGDNSAKQLLGSIAAQNTDLESQQRAVRLLNGIEKLSPSTRLNYAWMLIKSPYDEINDPQKAIKLSKSFSSKAFEDDATVLEIRAAAYASLGNFKEAISLQEDALDEAEDMDIDLETIKLRLLSYQENNLWF
jgi:TonB family protein